MTQIAEIYTISVFSRLVSDRLVSLGRPRRDEATNLASNIPNRQSPQYIIIRRVLELAHFCDIASVLSDILYMRRIIPEDTDIFLVFKTVF